MAILVTGGAGYIGSHCVASLLEAGADVAVVDDLSKGHRAALKGGRLYVGNVGERAFLREVFQKESIEAVIHFAAYSLVGESMDVPERYFRNNVTAGLSLIETMIEFQVPYLVFSSTAATYGEPEHIHCGDRPPAAHQPLRGEQAHRGAYAPVVRPGPRPQILRAALL